MSLRLEPRNQRRTQRQRQAPAGQQDHPPHARHCRHRSAAPAIGAFPDAGARFFGGGAPSAPPPPPPPPSKSDAEIQAEKAKASKLARNRKGRGASLLNPEAEGTNFLQPGDDTKRTTLG